MQKRAFAGNELLVVHAVLLLLLFGLGLWIGVPTLLQQRNPPLRPLPAAEHYGAVALPGWLALGVVCLKKTPEWLRNAARFFLILAAGPSLLATVLCLEQLWRLTGRNLPH